MLFFAGHSSTPLLLLDTALREPAQRAAEFSSVQYLQHHFPVYAAELPELIVAADKVVKEMDKEPLCHRIDTVATAHSMFLLLKDCNPTQSISVVLLTKIEETGTTIKQHPFTATSNLCSLQQKGLPKKAICKSDKGT